MSIFKIISEHQGLASLLTATLVLFAHSPQAQSAPAKAAPASTEAFILNQTHYFFGNMLVTATKNALRIQNTGSWKFVLVSKAPDWKVSVFRDDDKVCYQTSLKQFGDTGLVSKFLIGMTANAIGGTDKETSRTVGDVHIRHRENARAVCDYLPITGRIAPQCRDILFNVLRVPNCGGITLRSAAISFGKDWMTGVDETGQWNSQVATTSASLGKVDPHIFDVPANYKMVPSMQQVVTSKTARDTNSSGADELMR